MRRLMWMVLLLVGCLPIGVWAAPSINPLLLYQQQLVDKLAAQGSAKSLHAAALLAGAMGNQSHLSFHHLIAKASTAKDADTAIFWSKLADCDASNDECPNQQALHALEKMAPDNAAVWMMALAATSKRKQQQAMLQKAAHAGFYDDYSYRAQQRLLQATGQFLPPASVYQEGSVATSANGVRLLLTFGFNDLPALPALQSTARLCDRKKNRRALASNCQRLAHTLLTSDSPLAQSLGLHIKSGDEPHSHQQEQARQRLNWQLHKFSQLVLKAQNNTETAHTLMQLATRNHAFMPLIKHSLTHFDIALEPEMDWQAPRSALPKPTIADKPSNTDNNSCRQAPNTCIVIGTTLLPLHKKD